MVVVFLCFPTCSLAWTCGKGYPWGSTIKHLLGFGGSQNYLEFQFDVLVGLVIGLKRAPQMLRRSQKAQCMKKLVLAEWLTHSKPLTTGQVAIFEIG